MIRRIIQIDEEKCNGCGACAAACHEGAIGMVDGKAKLLRDDYCDGLGDCLPACPMDAISFVEREAAAYDAEAVKSAQEAAARKTATATEAPLPCGCPGSNVHEIKRPTGGCPGSNVKEIKRPASGGCPGSQAKSLRHPQAEAAGASEPESRFAEFDDFDGLHSTRPAVASQLSQWPVKIKLVPVNAPYFDGANLLIAADCTAYAYGDFHHRFIRNRITLVGCPKLDESDYTEKLTAIIRENDIRSVTIVRMEVPCCGGLERAAVQALKDSGKFIPWQVVVISTDGRIISE
ncbi:MAG TPA: 4Fe-4S binding protein [Candidatus Anaerobutyricum stercoripullorum]|uniref:4Fe-4S binding protein n=1 Tax=Candidatus Anaerobutyricum stercoripullorum TaxID=2838456 RepID=A0A9D2BD88_9FIRM|nr:4Fe-4S binding protein [Candidatus Anaerobutyricum stercoripullorum]